MKRISIFSFLSMMLLQACQSGESVPDVSNEQISTIVKRFDQDFFAIDTLHLDSSLNKLNNEYPAFLPNYLVKILGIDPGSAEAEFSIRSFLRSYHPVFQAADKMAAGNVPQLEQDMELALRYFRYYVPSWKPDSPFVITTFVGPMDAFEPFPLGDYGDVRTSDGVGVALQLHLGADADLYKNGQEAGIFYDYQTRRFTPPTMLVNSMKNVIVDAFPYTEGSGTLIDEMIEKGKRLYLLDKVLPETADTLKLGYTQSQLEGSYENEALIWNFFVKNDLLYSKDIAINQGYIKDGPKTQELGEGAPGYIGLFVGRQVVRAFMKNNPEVSIEELMQKSPADILAASKYKP